MYNNYKSVRKSNLAQINNFIVDLGSPSNISYFWNFGSLLGLSMLIQFMTGLFLTFHYSANVSVAFDSVIHIMRDVNSGWLIRYAHINGASFFFIFIYVHIGRGIFYFSFKKTMVWFSGIFILLFLMMVAFMGYILPWGQMSFWGATVITNLISSIPSLGETIVFWIWGGFSVGNATLNRFFSFHFIFPFLVMFLIFIHLIYLHVYGSNNPLGLVGSYDKVFFYPYYVIKDLFGFIFFMIMFLFLICFFPLILVDSDNFIMANSLVTPLHIQPEWYYLFSYAILRSIPNKLGGVVALFLSILILLVFMFCKSKFNSLTYYPIMEVIFWLFVAVVMLLMWIGANQVEHPFYILGQMLAFFFFFFFYIYIYLVNFWDSLLD
uniref:Cytochrome b n=1 Tax=Bemisia tabaci TaxID=7038 RepID=A0A1W5YJV3_BEMTA|nr:cytochrome b [Bemisia tabaci]ARI43913.1 cytochrome b [Bemisia tabaci]ATJ03316.1 cytochrome b [Bemisia tabaci]ATJ03329.1 cytochrome b [Bemisia tabaci]WEX31288.1 cytochrome b [Bemisia tabaci]